MERTDEAMIAFQRGLEIDPNYASILEAVKEITPRGTPEAEFVESPFAPPVPLTTQPE
jgi:hypothetical protein